MMSSRHQRDSFEPLYPEEMSTFDKCFMSAVVGFLLVFSVGAFWVTNIG
jgi:hypothetical protein